MGATQSVTLDSVQTELVRGSASVSIQFSPFFRVETPAIVETDLQYALQFLQKLHCDVPVLQQDGQSQCQQLLERLQNPILHVTVLGEFSAGKSTFLNALLGDDLLKSDILQGTTAAPTLLKPGPVLAAAVHQVDGSILHSQQLPKQALIEWIRRFTSDESTAKSVRKVIVEHPSLMLFEKLILQDLPGLNAENSRHLAVTLAALKQLSDLFIVMMPSISAASENLMTFLRNHMSGVLHRCIFVLTKADLLRNDHERELVLGNTKARLALALNLETEPVVKMVAAEVALQAQLGLDPNQGRSRALRESEIESFIGDFETTKTIVTELARNSTRPLVNDSLLDSSLRLIANSSLELSSHITKTTQTLLESEQKQIPALGDFIENAADDFSSVLQQELYRCNQRLDLAIQRLQETSAAELKKLIEPASVKLQLLNSLETNWPHLLQHAERTIRFGELASRSDLSDLARNHACVVMKRFSDQYAGYILQGTFGCPAELDSPVQGADASPTATTQTDLGEELANKLTPTIKKRYLLASGLLCWPVLPVAYVAYRMSHHCSTELKGWVEDHLITKLRAHIQRLHAAATQTSSVHEMQLANVMRVRLEQIRKEHESFVQNSIAQVSGKIQELELQLRNFNSQQKHLDQWAARLSDLQLTSAQELALKLSGGSHV